MTYAAAERQFGRLQLMTRNPNPASPYRGGLAANVVVAVVAFVVVVCPPVKNELPKGLWYNPLANVVRGGYA